MSLPVVRADGDPVRRGRAVGRALAEQIARSLDAHRAFLERRGIETADLHRLLGPHRAAAQRTLPDLVAEADAMAQGAGVDPWELFAVNASEELEPLLAPATTVERCTAFAVTTSEGTLLAHNEQWNAGYLGDCAVIVSVPEEGPALASPTIAANLPAVGLNASGVAQSILSLTARDDRAGVPRVFVSRHSLQGLGAEDTVGRATIGGRAGGYAHLVAGDDRAPFTVETTSARHAVVAEAAHTNHYLDPDLAGAEEPSAGSASRLRRLRDLLAERRPATPDEALDILRDHQAAPEAICVHPDPVEGDEAETILFTMVCHVESRRMWVAEGQPCEHPLEEVDLAEVMP